MLHKKKKKSAILNLIIDFSTTVHMLSRARIHQTILKNILCLLLHDLQIGMLYNFWLAKPYCLANQKLCSIQMLLDIEKPEE